MVGRPIRSRVHVASVCRVLQESECQRTAVLTSVCMLQAEVDRMVDAILRVTAGAVDSGRRMMFSSFDPDVCAALRQRQQHIPVRILGSQ